MWGLVVVCGFAINWLQNQVHVTRQLHLHDPIHFMFSFNKMYSNMLSAEWLPFHSTHILLTYEDELHQQLVVFFRNNHDVIPCGAYCLTLIQRIHVCDMKKPVNIATSSCTPSSFLDLWVFLTSPLWSCLSCCPNCCPDGLLVCVRELAAVCHLLVDRARRQPCGTLSGASDLIWWLPSWLHRKG